MTPAPTLEIGAGTGTNAIWLAEHGFDVLGIDVSPLAVERARAKMDGRALRCSFAALDFLAAPPPGGPFQFVFDRGCFHVFDEPDERERCAAQVAATLTPGGLWLSLIGSTEGPPREFGPPRRSAREVSFAIEPVLEIVELRAAEFRGHGAPAWFTGHRSLVCGRMISADDVLEMSGSGLRSLVARDGELSEIFMRSFILRRLILINRSQGNVILMGSRYSAGTLRLREFLTRNGHPYVYVDLDVDQESQALLDRFAVSVSEIPVVICNYRTVLRNPSIQELSDSLELNCTIDESQVRDLIIVGAGPAGLAAAVYGASEGLDVLMVESAAPGGQAASNSKIENYLGFPTGLSGDELATRAITQAQKFGAKLMVAHSVVRLECEKSPYRLVLENGKPLEARSVVIATGAQYNNPENLNLERFVGQGVYYGATFMEAQLCESEDLIVVGGGNSAGQAAVFLAQTARKVHMLIRSQRLSESMSR